MERKFSLLQKQGLSQISSAEISPASPQPAKSNKPAPASRSKSTASKAATKTASKSKSKPTIRKKVDEMDDDSIEEEAPPTYATLRVSTDYIESEKRHLGSHLKLLASPDWNSHQAKQLDLAKDLVLLHGGLHQDGSHPPLKTILTTMTSSLWNNSFVDIAYSGGGFKRFRMCCFAMDYPQSVRLLRDLFYLGDRLRVLALSLDARAAFLISYLHNVVEQARHLLRCAGLEEDH